MTAPTPRPRPSPDPVRQQLVEVRRGLLRLHKALIDSERRVYEQQSGAMSSGQFLQALIQNPFFAWLRPFSTLIVEIDEAVAAREGVAPEEARIFVTQARALLEPEGEMADRYERARERDSGVLMAHLELSRRIEAAES